MGGAVVSICNGLFIGRNGRTWHASLWLNRHTSMQLRGASRGLPDPASFPPRLDTALVTVGFRLGQGRELEMQYVDRRLSPFVRRCHRPACTPRVSYRRRKTPEAQNPEADPCC